MHILCVRIEFARDFTQLMEEAGESVCPWPPILLQAMLRKSLAISCSGSHTVCGFGPVHYLRQ